MLLGADVKPLTWPGGGLVLSRGTRATESSVVYFKCGPCIFSHPSDAPLPGHHDFAKDDSFLLKIKMMQRLLRHENESQLIFLYQYQNRGGEIGIEFCLIFLNSIFKIAKEWI